MGIWGWVTKLFSKKTFLRTLGRSLTSCRVELKPPLSLIGILFFISDDSS